MTSKLGKRVSFYEIFSLELESSINVFDPHAYYSYAHPNSNVSSLKKEVRNGNKCLLYGTGKVLNEDKNKYLIQIPKDQVLKDRNTERTLWINKANINCSETALKVLYGFN